MLKILLALKTPSDAMLSLLGGHHVDQSEDSLINMISKKRYELVIVENGLELLPAIKRADPRVEVIIIGRGEENAIDAVREGASAYFSYPIDFQRLKETIEGVNDHFEICRETAQMEKLLQSKYTFAGVVGRDPQMLDIFNFMRRIAPYFKVVTITGETGTGKEVIARALHSLSPGHTRPFVVCNCGGLVENLVESELFGHKKGSFTGAIADKIGLFEAAGEGTLFLDEVGELPLSFQPRLLRVLQDGEFRPVGSHTANKARCRIIAATNRDLSQDMKAGRFREDLYYRLTPLTVFLPPLRERKDDILLLSRFLLESFTRRTGKKIFGFSRQVQTLLISYNWPGNVRELQSTVEQAAIMAAESFIRVDDLPAYIKEFKKVGTSPSMNLEEAIKKHISLVIADCKGNRTKAAKILGISRRSLLRKIEKYSI